jgi:predicted ribosomally synthesized peptide with nif11-like leader
MAQQEVTRLFRVAQTNFDLKAKLSEAPDVETFVEMARKHGYEFTVEEWRQATSVTLDELPSKVSEIPGL